MNDTATLPANTLKRTQQPAEAALRPHQFMPTVRRGTESARCALCHCFKSALIHRAAGGAQ